MATHGKGLICAPLTEKRCDELELHSMVKNNTDHMETAFTVSVDLKGQGVTNEGIVSTRLGLKGIPNLAEELIVARNLFILEYTGGKLHIPTISTAKSVELIKEAKAKGLTERKRYYYCNYGIDNYKDIVLGKTDQYKIGDNYEKHNLDNIITWWKNKASNRYDTLKSEGRLRTEIEVWTSGKPIDIIR
jgi:hypothetical protein